MRNYSKYVLAFSLVFGCGAARAQSAAPPVPPPEFYVYQGKTLNLTLDQAVREINALSPIAYVDPQMSNDFTAKPVHDVEKIAVTPVGGHIEFWSDDSLDGMAMESSFDVLWRQVSGRNVYIVNNPENGQNYQVEVATGGNFIIRNAFRNVDDAGHLAPLQQGDPDNMFTFDNAGDYARARRIADLLSTLISLSNAAAPAAQFDDTADVTAAPAGDDSGADVPIAAPDPVTPVIAGTAAPAPAPVPLPPGAVAAPGVTLTDVAPAPAPAPPPATYVHPATSYFEGNFAVRVTPGQAGTAAVDVINISSKTHRVAVSVTACSNVLAGDCGAKFKGPLGPGMKLSFTVSGTDLTQPWDFHVLTAQNGA